MDVLPLTASTQCQLELVEPLDNLLSTMRWLAELTDILGDCSRILHGV